MAFIFACTALSIAALAAFERRVNLRCDDGARGHIGLFMLAAILGVLAWVEYADGADRGHLEIARGADGCIKGGLDDLTRAALQDEAVGPVWLCGDET